MKGKTIAVSVTLVILVVSGLTAILDKYPFLLSPQIKERAPTPVPTPIPEWELPVMIGDTVGKVRTRCGPTTESSSYETPNGYALTLDFSHRINIPNDCIAMFTFVNGKLYSISR